MNIGSDNQNNIKSEDISGFSIQENEGKTALHILLKQGEQIEIQVSNHIRELYDLLADNQQNIENILTLIKRVEANTLRHFADKKTMTPLSFSSKDLSKLIELSSRIKVISAETKGSLVHSAQKEGLLLLSHASGNYGPKDIISQERIKNNMQNLDKLFIAFQKVWFSDDDPRPLSHRPPEERISMRAEFMQIFDEKMEFFDKELNDESETEDKEEGKTLQKYRGELCKLGLKDEIEKLFSEGAIIQRYFEVYRACKEEKEISKDISEIMSTGYQVYKKLQLLGLYHQKKLHIKTAQGSEIFTGPEMAHKSLDGKLYYKDHEAKYKEGGRSFVCDWGRGDEQDVHIQLTDLKIEDLSYGALDEAFSLLGKGGLAPIFSIILVSSMLPHLLHPEESKKFPPKEASSLKQ